MVLMVFSILHSRFVTEFVKEPKRGYGSTIVDVFQALRLSNFEDPYGPAQRQFGGMGSYGNGAAMRVAPIALYAHENTPSLLQLVEKGSRITHTNRLGIRGAILQALAVQAALRLPSTGTMDVVAFAEGLLAQMKELEGAQPQNDLEEASHEYVTKLGVVKEFLAKETPPSREEVDEKLGVNVSAHRSVPTALYCFLAAQKPIPEINVSQAKRILCCWQVST